MGKVLEGEELEEMSEELEQLPLYICKSISISLTNIPEIGDVLVLGIEFIDDNRLLFAYHPDCIQHIIEGLEGASSALRKKNAN